MIAMRKPTVHAIPYAAIIPAQGRNPPVSKRAAERNEAERGDREAATIPTHLDDGGRVGRGRGRGMSPAPG